MDKEELLSLIEKEERNCISSTSGALSEQRREAMQYYNGLPYGNEIEGRSQVVTTEVKDAVEGILPALIAIFLSSDEVVRFEPQNQEDEAAAQQATDYINYIFSRLNNGFLVLYCLFKDALLQKNGYSKVYWEDYTDQGIETYENISPLEIAMLLQDSELELVDAEIEEGAQAYTKVVLRRTKKYGKVCVDPVPPEEILISREAPNDLTKARFVEHRTRKTISQIREMGFDVEDDISDFAGNADFNLERVERFKYDDAEAYRNDQSADPASREVWLCEAYLYVDFDGDGIAEFRKITKVGKTILDNEEFDSLPIVGGTAILMPHKHYGLSIHDLVKDIQLIKTTITRQLLDNAYVANNGRMIVLDGMVNLEDLLNARPNGIVRAKAMNAVQRMENPLLGAPFYNLLEYFDKVKVNRVGSRDFGDAVDPDALNAKAHTAELVSNAAQERINLMARLLAEGPVKAIFWKILELVSKHQNKPQMVKLRGTWVQVDPREWKDRFNMTVTVGLGTGSQKNTIQGAMAILGAQTQLAQLGLANRVVSEKNFFHGLRTLAKAIFPKDADQFATDPSTLPQPQQQPNPEIMKIQQKDASDQRKLKQRYDKMQQDFILNIQKMAQDKGIALADLGLQAATLTQDAREQRHDRMHEHIQGERDRATELAGLHIQNDHQRQISDSRTQ